jgi:antitoxin component YwqK of YwqJK toxin-antitoxin module
MNQRILFFLITFFALSCADEGPNNFEVVKKRYNTGEKEIVFLYTVIDEDTLKVGEKEFFQNGALHMERFWDTNGKKQGVWSAWYDNGNLWSQHTYVNDTIDGDYKTWHKNGQVFISGRYKMGKEIGTWNYYSKTGEIDKQLNF